MDDLREQLERLQESHAFTDYRTDQLSQQIIDLFERIGQIERSLRAMEGRIEQVEHPEPDRDDSTEVGG